jgi:hypothetical protein
VWWPSRRVTATTPSAGYSTSECVPVPFGRRIFVHLDLPIAVTHEDGFFVSPIRAVCVDDMTNHPRQEDTVVFVVRDDVRLVVGCEVQHVADVENEPATRPEPRAHLLKKWDDFVAAEPGMHTNLWLWGPRGSMLRRCGGVPLADCCLAQDIFPKQLIKLSALHRVGLQQSGCRDLKVRLLLSEIRFDLVHDRDGVVNSYLPTYAMCYD